MSHEKKSHGFCAISGCVVPFVRFQGGPLGVTSGSRCYKISMKNSFKHIQDGRPGWYKNRRRTPKNVQTDHLVVPDSRRHPEEAEKRMNPSVVPYYPGKCRKRPSRIKVQPVSGSLQELQNLLGDARGTLSS